MNLLPFVTKLEEAGLGTAGTSIFINRLPATAKQGILLRQRLAGTDIDHEIPGRYKTAFQVIVRDPSYEVAEALARQVMDTLNWGDCDEALEGMRVFFLRARHLPISFPTSDGDLIESSVNFDIGFDEVQVA